MLFTHEKRVQEVTPFLDVALFKHVLLLIGIKGDIGGQEIHQIHRVVDVFHGKCQVTAVLTHVAQHAQGDFGNGLHQNLKFLVSGQRQLVFDQGDRAAHVRCRLGHVVQLASRPSLQDDVGRAVGQFQHLDDGGNGAITVQVLLGRILDMAVILAENSDRAMAFLCLLDQTHGFVATYRYRHGHHGKQHHVAQGQDGDVISLTVVNISAVVHFMNLGDDGNHSCSTIVHLGIYIV